MMFSGFNADYEASSSRCSSASPAGDSLSYYHSPADSFSSMGSPVNAQVSLTLRSRQVRAGGSQRRGRRGGTLRDVSWSGAGVFLSHSGGRLARSGQP